MQISVLLAGLLAGLLAIAALCDARAAPHDAGRRAWVRRAGMGILMLAELLLFGAALALTGRVVAAAILVLVLVVVCVAGSNVKRGLLGEALIFSDLAIVKACIRHPRFYVSAVAWPARGLLLTGLAGMAAVVVVLFVHDIAVLRPAGHAIGYASGSGRGPGGEQGGRLALRLAGVVIACAAWGALRLVGHCGLARRLLPEADLEAGVARFGLLPALALGWLRWRDDIARPAWIAPPPLASRGVDRPGPIVVVVQCESFADPRDFHIDPATVPHLPHLCDARAHGRSGRLNVSGFGAYTMRTEFGVLFGIEEGALGFERFDPYLSAERHAGFALPKRLAGYCAERAFIHPYDLRFYRRDRLMPAIGFTETIGAAAFAGAETHGPHVSDRALGAYLQNRIAKAARTPGGTLLHAVSIENHGPWRDGAGAYMRHLANGDAMLGDVAQALAGCGRPAILVFFGDHRPTLPGVTQPGADRSTPFVIRAFNTAADISGPGSEILTPAALHHAIVDSVGRVAGRV